MSFKQTYCEQNEESDDAAFSSPVADELFGEVRPEVIEEIQMELPFPENKS